MVSNVQPVDFRPRSAVKWMLVLAVFALLAAACSGSDITVQPADTGQAATPEPTAEVPTPSPAEDPTATPEPEPTAIPTPTPTPDPRLTELYPVDEDVRIGTLDNGLTYYIRNNDSPGTRASLRLVVDAGSGLETDAQSGAAHFLEHMVFNGTEQFPANELIATLESFGAEFGPDVNAYTSFDETVYELTIPTDDPDAIDAAFDVLREFAVNATLDPAEVTAERGVVLEEWRQNAQGVGGRVTDVYSSLLLDGSDYADRDPIGDPDAIVEMETSTLRDFYEDWYRPELMAVVAVGDFDVDEIEEIIVDRFEPLTNSDDAPARPELQVETGGPQEVAVLADPEATSSFVEVSFPITNSIPSTVGSVAEDWARVVAFQILATRLGDDVSRGGTPFFSADWLFFNLTRPMNVWGLSADTDAEGLLESAELLFEELERGSRFGFTDDELERAVETYRVFVENSYEARGTTQDREYADRYVENFLSGRSIPDATFERDSDLELLNELTPERVQAALAEFVDGIGPQVLVVGSDDPAVPTQAEVEAVIAEVKASEIEPREEQGATADRLMDRPQAGPVDRQPESSIGSTELILDNGVRVILLPTNISDETIVFGAQSPGGLSLVDDDDVSELQLADSVIPQSGVADLDQVSVDRLLSDKSLFLAPVLDDVTEGWSGESSTDDIETLLQLIHLYMTEPRVTDAALTSTISSLRPLLEAPEDIPGAAGFFALFELRFGDEQRLKVFPPAADLDDIDGDALRDAFAARYADADDFLYVFAGDLDVDEMEPLLASYLGTLPTIDGSETAQNMHPDPPPGIARADLNVGQDEQGEIVMLWTEPASLSADDRVGLEVLETIVGNRLIDDLRERLGVSYSPFVDMSEDTDPNALVETYLQVAGDPERLTEIEETTVEIIEDLLANGPTAEEFTTASEQRRREFELVSNEGWIEDILFYEANDLDISDVFRLIQRLDTLSAEEIQALAARVLVPDQYIVVTTRPA